MSTVEDNVKRKWVLDGLDCANCAMKIENKVKKIEGVSSCSVNFATKTMTLETTAAAADEIAEQAEHTVTKLEPHVKPRQFKLHGRSRSRCLRRVQLRCAV